MMKENGIIEENPDYIVNDNSSSFEIDGYDNLTNIRGDIGEFVLYNNVLINGTLSSA